MAKALFLTFHFLTFPYFEPQHRFEVGRQLGDLSGMASELAGGESGDEEQTWDSIRGDTNVAGGGSLEDRQLGLGKGVDDEAVRSDLTVY